MFQKLIIVGHVGRDPELRYTQSGVAVTDFSIATNEVWGSGDDRQEKTTWFRVTCWRGLAETVAQYVKKGKPILVEGTVDATAWTDDSGNPRAQLEITARTVKFLPSGDRQGPPPPESLGDIPF